jgi:hypothetical protein
LGHPHYFAREYFASGWRGLHVKYEMWAPGLVVLAG